MASKDEIFEKVKAIVVEVLGEDVQDKLTMNSHYYNDLGADSVQWLEIVATTEREFKTEIPREILKEFCTIGDTVKFLAAHA